MATLLSRSEFGKGVAAAAASVALVRSPARAAEFQWKLALNAPLENPWTIRLIEAVHAIKRESRGRLEITVFPNSSLGNDTQMIAQVRSGAIQMLSEFDGALTAIAPLTGINAVGFAFKSQKQATDALDGELGAAIRKNIEAAGLVTFEKSWVNGFRQITSSSKAIKTPDDLVGFKIRTPVSKLWVDMFQTLGAAPTPINAAELYTALQTHIVDGQENPFVVIETFRFYEVQKYISVTNHMYSAIWNVANAEAWKSLPPDLQQIVRRNLDLGAVRDRHDAMILNATLRDKLARRGLKINDVDTAPFRAKLRPFYARWKNEFGSSAWALLEEHAGKLG